MKCLSCDVILSSFEATRKYKNTQNYVDLCNRCFASISDLIQTTSRRDLINSRDEDWDDDDDDDENN